MKQLAALVLMLSLPAVSSMYLPHCKGLSDIVVAIPGSDIITQRQLLLFEKFLGDFVDYFPLNVMDGTRIGLVQYGKNATVTSSLDPFKTQIELKTRISLMCRREISPSAYMGGYNPSTGIDAIREEVVKSRRAGAQALGLIVTIGPTPDYYTNDVVTSSQQAMAENITMLAVSMLSSGTEFAQMTDTSCKRFHITDFNGLDDTLPYIATQLCNYLQGVPSFPILCLNPATPLLTVQPTPSFTCPSPNGNFPDPTNCAYYYTCVNGEAARTMCSSGMLFDPVAIKCELKEFSSCYADYNCPLGWKGQLPYVGDCTKFVNCWEGRAAVQPCGPGLYFDKNLQSCDFAANVLCPYGGTKTISML